MGKKNNQEWKVVIENPEVLKQASEKLINHLMDNYYDRIIKCPVEEMK